MQKIVVVNNPKNWKFHNPEVLVVSSKDYLTNPEYLKMRDVRIFNLCSSYRYQSKGYYVSLLAEARSHKAMPSLKTIEDLKTNTIVKIVSEDTDDLIQKSLKKILTDSFELNIYFGRDVHGHHDKLCKELINLFQSPLLKAVFKRIEEKWEIQSVKPIPLKDIPIDQLHFVQEFADQFFNRQRYNAAKADTSIYDLAILVNPDERHPPSDRKALVRFIAAAEDVGFSVELITHEDYNRIGEFDALFIRETTTVNHHTYRFARRGEVEGLVVIDDPQSILRCTNKVYLAELLANARINIPGTMIVHSENQDEVMEKMGLPCVLKLPDSSFSQGVIKVKTEKELKQQLFLLLKESDLIIAQKFMPTPFDWRIGVLDGEPLFACKYFMAKDHWQIYNWEGQKKNTEGDHESFAIEDVPENVINVAIKATKLIGRGLYGVDLKEIDGKAVVIEINDNPNIDYGVEDFILKDKLYERLANTFRKRIDKLRKRKDNLEY